MPSRELDVVLLPCCGWPVAAFCTLLNPTISFHSINLVPPLLQAVTSLLLVFLQLSCKQLGPAAAACPSRLWRQRQLLSCKLAVCVSACLSHRSLSCQRCPCLQTL